MRHDDIDFESYEFRGEAGKTLGLAAGPPVLAAEVLAFNVTAIAQSLPERVGRGCVLRGPGGAEESDASGSDHRLGARDADNPRARDARNWGERQRRAN
jgi:hypothetical protein